MKKQHVIAAAVLALGLSGGAALAANISNLNGQACAAGTIGLWHFVNNQTGGAAAGTLTATWSSGNSCVVGAAKVTATNQHFYCTASGELTSASTNLPGRLVLSDYTCTDVKDPPPPTCDPKKEICK